MITPEKNTVYSSVTGIDYIVVTSIQEGEIKGITKPLQGDTWNWRSWATDDNIQEALLEKIGDIKTHPEYFL